MKLTGIKMSLMKLLKLGTRKPKYSTKATTV